MQQQAFTSARAAPSTSCMRRWMSLPPSRGRTVRLGSAVVDALISDASVAAEAVAAAPVLSPEPVSTGDAASIPASYAAESLPSVVMKRRNAYDEQLQGLLDSYKATLAAYKEAKAQVLPLLELWREKHPEQQPTTDGIVQLALAQAQAQASSGPGPQQGAIRMKKNKAKTKQQWRQIRQQKLRMLQQRQAPPQMQQAEPHDAEQVAAEARQQFRRYQEVRQRLLVELPLLRDQLASVHQQEGKRQKKSLLQARYGITNANITSNISAPQAAAQFYRAKDYRSKRQEKAEQVQQQQQQADAAAQAAAAAPGLPLGLSAAGAAALEAQLKELQGVQMLLDAPPSVSLADDVAAALAAVGNNSNEMQRLAMMAHLAASASSDVAGVQAAASSSAMQQPPQLMQQQAPAQQQEASGAPAELLRANNASARIKSAAMAALKYKKSKAQEQGQQAAADSAPAAAPAAPAQPAVVLGVVERAKFNVYSRPQRSFYHNDPEDPDSQQMVVVP